MQPFLSKQKTVSGQGKVANAHIGMVQNIFSDFQPPRQYGWSETAPKIAAEAFKIFEDLYFLLNKSPHSRKLHLEGTPLAIEKLSNLWRNSGSVKVLELFYHLTFCYHLYRFDFQAVLDFGVQFQDLLNGLSDEMEPRTLALAAINNCSMAYACLKLKDYTRGFQLAQSDNEIYPMKPLGEVSFSETAFILAIREKRYQEAEAISVQALQKSGSRETSLSTLRWKILQGYLRLIAEPEKSERLFDFITIRSEVGQLAGGPSLVVLLNILEFSCLLAVHKTVDASILFSEIDGSFKKYRTINQVEAKRLEWFRGFLFTLVKNEFDIEKINPSAIKILVKLKTDIDPYSPTEIIPFYELGRSYLQRLRS